MKLGTIKEEAAACRRAFKGVEIGSLVWLCNHEILIEPLSEPARHRINYILMSKPLGEQARRLREFRPVLGSLPDEFNRAYAEFNRADAKWNKARAERNKADAKWNKAYIKRNRVYTKLKPALIALHLSECPNTTWNGKSIF